MTRRRRLSPEEADLWQTVARSARPLHNPHLPLPDPPAPSRQTRPARPKSPSIRPSRASPISTSANARPSPARTTLPPPSPPPPCGWTPAPMPA